jgi:spore maturation protein CgeB
LLTKVLVVGSWGRLVHWTESTVKAFKQAGCDVDHFASNGTSRVNALYLKLRRKLAGDDQAQVAEDLRRKVAEFQPDLIVFVLGSWLSDLPFQAATEACPKAIKVAWVGDLFDEAQGAFAKHMDWVFCTDTYFIELLRQYNDAPSTSYLPLAMDPQRFFPIDTPRNNKIVYVARNSPSRAELISKIELPLMLYGKQWRRSMAKFKNSPHEISLYHLPISKLPQVYASCRAVLNIKNEIRVARGINMRSFEPYGCMTPVLNDDVADLNLCFELGSEILVYRDLEELHEWHAKLTTDVQFAQKIGLAGHKRVIAHHTYAHRAQAMLKQIGLK